VILPLDTTPNIVQPHTHNVIAFNQAIGLEDCTTDMACFGACSIGLAFMCKIAA
jgi:hypothetical protein